MNTRNQVRPVFLGERGTLCVALFLIFFDSNGRTVICTVEDAGSDVAESRHHCRERGPLAPQGPNVMF